jgi:hypothetical protein
MQYARGWNNQLLFIQGGKHDLDDADTVQNALRDHPQEDPAHICTRKCGLGF